jgi:hypothetical protein
MRVLDSEEKKLRLGKMGEICVGNWASMNGSVVTHAIDPYDSKKDLIIDGATVEVKTQTPYILENGFTIRANQINKCRNVDVLYFVSLPSPHARFINPDQGWVYVVDPKTFKYREIITRAGNKMLIIDIKQDAVAPLFKIDPAEIAQMMVYHSGQ